MREEREVAEAGFSTVDRRSHLLSFGEYMAMYLFVWSDIIWPPTTPTYDDLMSWLAESENLAVQRGALKIRASIESNTSHVAFFRSRIWQARRALANVPSYMIFDDHEITDDWNMYRVFTEKVYNSPLGARVVQNGLVAYALCQHWGNAPEQFTRAVGLDPAGKRLLALLGGAASYADVADDPALRRIVGIHTPAELAQRTPYGVYHDVGTRAHLSDGTIDTDSLLFHYPVTLVRVDPPLLVRSDPAVRSGLRA